MRKRKRDWKYKSSWKPKRIGRIIVVGRTRKGEKMQGKK